MRYRTLTAPGDLAPFRAIEPPFQFNSPNIAVHSPEVTGFYLLEGLRKRLNWDSFADKTLLDLGCGVRFARTIYNLGLPFGLYFGVDVNRDSIAWLQANAVAPNLRFAHLPVRNALYNPEGGALGAEALREIGVPTCDAVSMFSVITHQSPTESALTFAQCRQVVGDGGRLYFTAFLDEDTEEYWEAGEVPGALVKHNPDRLLALTEGAGWRVDSIHRQEETLQQAAFVCTAV